MEKISGTLSIANRKHSNWIRYVSRNRIDMRAATEKLAVSGHSPLYNLLLADTVH